MERSNLIPFLRTDLDILFVGLNPAKGSSDNGHYFSVKQSFWNQLYNSGLITQYLDKSNADDLVFGSKYFNYGNWNFGITDLVTEFAESNSRKIKPTIKDYQRLENTIREYKPLTVVLLHGIVLNGFLKYLHLNAQPSNTGVLGRLLEGIPTIFFNVAFPHGNSIPDLDKIEMYNQLKKFIEK
ncbi:MAG: uracil-DNA glycosylase family protein [Sphingobacteriales bacterium]